MTLRIIIAAVFSLLMLSSCKLSKQVLTKVDMGPAFSKAYKTFVMGKYRDDDYDAVYLYKTVGVEHWGNPTSKWVYKINYFRSYIVLNPNAESWAVFRLNNISDASLYKVRLNVYEPDGTVHNFTKVDLKKTTDSNGKTRWSLAYPGIKRGTVVEELYILVNSVPRNRPPVDQSFTIQRSIPIEHYSFQFAYPEWWDVQFKEIAPDSTLPMTRTVDEDNQKIIYSFKARRVPAYREESYAPYYKSDGMYIEWLVKKMVMAGYSFEGNKSWEDVSIKFHEYAVDNDAFFSRRVQTITDSLTRGASDSLQRLERIIGYLQSQIKNEFSYDVDDFADVLKYKKGDPFIITGLARLMLDEAGIPADYLLIHSARKGYFDPDYYTLDQVNTPALLLRLNHQDYLIMPYEKYLDYRTIPPYFLDQPALKLPRELGSREPGQIAIVKTPSTSLMGNSYKTEMALDIDEEGLIHVTEKHILRGSMAFLLRSQFEDMEEEEKKNFLEELPEYEEGLVVLTDSGILNEEDTKKPLILTLNYTIENLVSVMPDEVIFQTAGLFSPTNINKLTFNPKKRQHKIEVRIGENNSKEITIRYPESWTIQNRPEDFSFDNKYGSAGGSFSFDNNQMIARFYNRLNRITGPAEEISEFVKIKNMETKLIVPDIIFKVTE